MVPLAAIIVHRDPSTPHIPSSPILIPNAAYQTLLDQFVYDMRSLVAKESSLIRPCLIALEGLPRSSGGKYELWKPIIDGFIEYFNAHLSTLHSIAANENNHLHEQCKRCKQFISDLYDLYQKIPISFNSTGFIQKISDEMNRWQRFSYHFLLMTSFSPLLRQRIQKIVATNITDQTDHLYLKINDTVDKRLTTFKEMLEILFGKRFVPLIFLGKGSSKIVYLAYEETTKRVVAVGLSTLFLKVISQGQHLYNSHEKDISLRLSGRPGIIDTFEVKEIGLIKGQKCILQGFVQEFMDSDLFNLVNAILCKKPTPIPCNESTIRDLTIKILDALQSLEDYQVIHRDLRGENIFYKLDESGLSLKIADLGMSQSTDQRPLPLPPVKYAYRAPEEVLCPGQHFTTKLDVYSVGLLLYLIHWHEIKTYQDPLTKIKESSLINTMLQTQIASEYLAAIRSPDWLPNKSLPNNAYHTIMEVVWKMLQYQPQQRCSAKEAYSAVRRLYKIDTPTTHISSSAAAVAAADGKPE